MHLEIKIGPENWREEPDGRLDIRCAGSYFTLERWMEQLD